MRNMAVESKTIIVCMDDDDYYYPIQLKIGSKH